MLLCFKPIILASAVDADKFQLPRLILQRFFEGLESTETIAGEEKHRTIDQRDCVENLVRNLLMLSFLYPDGEIRPGVKEKILDKSPILTACYVERSAADRISEAPELGRDWLDRTLGFESFGVKYMQYNREVLPGINNILALMEG